MNHAIWSPSMLQRYPTMIIRNAENKDIQALSHLAQITYSDAFGHSFLPSDLAAHLEYYLSPSRFIQILEQDTIFLADIDGRLVGFVQFGMADGYPQAYSDRDRALRKLYVLGDYQNRGIGRLLMEAALGQMEQEKADRIFLDVWEHNPGARRFYERYGFRVIGKKQFAVASGTETSLDLIMVRHRGNIMWKT